jgi:hypothetical protein
MPTLIEKHLAYVDNAAVSSQKRQQKLWKQVTARRGRGGILPLTDPLLDEYMSAARMTASLMIDIEMVRDEYFAQQGGGSGKASKKSGKKAGKKKSSPRRKK